MKVMSANWDDVFAYVKDHNIQPDELDDLVHDAKSNEASVINNSGVDDQLAYLQEVYVDPEDLKIILEEQLKIYRGT